MHGLSVLRDLVILVGMAIPVVMLAHRLRAPTITAFLLAGVATGPHGLALLSSPDSVAELAEIGVVLLLFTIGLELSLSRILTLGKELLLGGSLQVGGTIAAVSLLLLTSELEPRRAVFYGAITALSSTAIVLKALAERGEIDAPHGRVTVALLLFQDLAVVPLMLLVPLLGGVSVGGRSAWAQILEGLLVVAALVAFGRLLVPRLLDRLVLFKDRELFTLCILFLGLGAAFLTASFGLSLALGAFLAGLVVSESEYGLQALSDVLPFRDTFSGVFFTSVGMLLDLGFVRENLGAVLLVAGAVILLKGVIATGVVLALGRDFVTSFRAGASLAQVGEFSFILASVGAPLGLFAAEDYQRFLAASVLTMFATPALIVGAGPVARLLKSLKGWSQEAARMAPEQNVQVSELSDHAIVVGYGLSGRHLARVLQAASIPFVALEQNGRVVREARRGEIPIFYGDGSRREVLHHAGVERARVIVFAIASPADERRGVAVAHELNPRIKNVVRTRYVRSIDELTRLGATAVVVEEYEATLELFSRVLEFYEIPTNTIRRELDAIRGEHYRVLREQAPPSMALDAIKHLGIRDALDLVEVEAGSRAIGESPTSLRVRSETGAIVLAVVRGGRALYRPDPDFAFRPGDTVVLVGDRDSLAEGSRLFRDLDDAGGSS